LFGNKSFGSEQNLVEGKVDKCELSAEARAIRVVSSKIIKRFRQDLLQNLDTAGIDLPPSQYLTLRFLLDKHMTLIELSRQLHVGSPTLCPMVDILVSKGLIERKRDLEDRRCTLLGLTPQGKELVASSSGLDENDGIEKGLCQLGEEKSRALVLLLSEFAQCITAQPAEPGDEISLFDPKN
jgi:DNA-binding MarR family transcriptional regulator